jgi:hypothetical protein
LEENKLTKEVSCFTNDGEKMQMPGHIDLLEDLPEEFTFAEPYSGAKYQLSEATDFSDEWKVPVGGGRNLLDSLGEKLGATLNLLTRDRERT